MKAPEIKHYINWLGRVEYRNINCSFTYDETSYAAIDRIFSLLHRLEPGPENTSWELWLRAERGTIEDFGSFEELREDGQVENVEEFETWWHSEFPEEAAWFHFAAGEDQEIGYRAIFLGHRHVLEVDGRRERSFPNDISKFTAWLEEAVRDAVQMVETGSYQGLVERELPIWHRTGTILRRDLWRVFPQWKEEFFQDFSQQEMEEFLTSAVGYPLEKNKRLPSMTGLSGYGLHRNGEIGKRAVRPPRRWAGRGTVQAGRRFPRSLCSVAERASPHRSPLGGMQGRQQHPHRLHRTPGCTWLLSGGGRSCGDPDD